LPTLRNKVSQISEIGNVLIALGQINICSGEGSNPYMAIQFWEKAIEFGHLQANYFLGLAYLAGKVVQRDVVKGKELIKEAANFGYPSAIYLSNQLENKNVSIANAVRLTVKNCPPEMHGSKPIEVYAISRDLITGRLYASLEKAVLKIPLKISVPIAASVILGVAFTAFWYLSEAMFAASIALPILFPVYLVANVALIYYLTMFTACVLASSIALTCLDPSRRIGF